jgi:hypothetical protein
MDPTASARFPWWIPAGAVLLAAAYLPTLSARFDFIDDGNLVYPDPPGTTARGHLEVWWVRVAGNYQDLGPFRPTLWAHWQVLSNTVGADPLGWRVWRLAWCTLAAGMLLWLFRELRIHPVAAVAAGALAMWNPYRNEIWTSLTLGEGVAMPYALFALVAARRAATSPEPLSWDIASAVAVVVALGCKNTFIAIIPAQVVLRLWPDGVTLRAAWAANGWRALALSATAALPVAHYLYFKAYWHPGQYEPQAPSLLQLVRVLSGLKGAMSADYMALGFGLLLAAVWAGTRAAGGVSRSLARQVWESHRAALLCAGLLAAAGVFVYLPMSAMSGRYVMPAVWGLDLLFALALTGLVRLPATKYRCAAWAGIAAGLTATLVTCELRQEKLAARSEMLWEALRYCEEVVPPGGTVAWVGGDPLRGELGVEEGVHFRWHIEKRGHNDVRILLLAADGSPIDRPEVERPTDPPRYRLSAEPPTDPGWEPVKTFEAKYGFGRKRFTCVLSRRAGEP